MTKPIYINGTGCISIQPTFEKDYFFGEIAEYNQNPVPAIDPVYRTHIPPLQLRRMNKSMKMALYAAKLALEDAQKTTVDAVITGSGLGCLRDSERFVENMLENHEQLLNPTPFIQSTHNMAAATIALALDCRGYNMTYVNNANSMETAILDGMLYLQEHPGETVLLGGVDELGDRTIQFWDLAGYLKNDAPKIPTPVHQPTAPGEIAAEGASFFVASSVREETSYAKITAVKTHYEVPDVGQFVTDFLSENQIALHTIDAVVLGNNGDNRYDHVYKTLSNDRFAKHAQLVYKHILGEYDTVCAAAIALSAKVMRHQAIPLVLRHNDVIPKTLNNILIYNQRRGRNHSLIHMSNEL